jgi:large subunit ribosomal protein L6
LYAILLRNNIYGYLRNFKNYLLIKGLGYKVKLENNILNFKLGYSHNILYPIPEGISINILPKKLKALKIVGSDCQLVKEVSIRIKNFKKPNSYKVQGIFFYKEKKKLKDSKKKSR